MPQITPLLVQLSLIMTPPADQERDDYTLERRIDYLEQALAAVRDLALYWATERGPDDGLVDFEAKQIEAIRQLGRASAEVALAMGEAKHRREHPERFEVGGTAYRLTSPEPRSLLTWFGTVRYGRSYARPLEGGPGWSPLDAELGLLGDRISPSLLATGARLSTRVSFAEAHEVLGGFVPQAPSTEVLEQTVLGLGHHTREWFESVAAPTDDGEVLVILIDGKCVPTARAEELEQRRGPRKDKPKAPSPRHRGRMDRKARTPRPRRKKGDKAKNGKLVTMVVMYTLRREGDLLLGPLNRRVYASFGPKRHAFAFALEEAKRRGFEPSTDKTVQLLTDRDPDLHCYADEYFPASKFAGRVVTVDVKYVIAKRCDHGGMRWSRERAQAVIQLRCIDVNEQWDAFVSWTFGRLRATARELGQRMRLQAQTALKLPSA